MGKKLLVIATPYWSYFTHKLNKFNTMATVSKEKINTMIHLLDFNSTDSSIMLQNQLLQVKESSSMSDMLPELDSSNPLIRIGLNSCARITHVFLLNILNNICLFKYCTIKDLLLNSHPELDPLGMRFSPNKFRIYQINPFLLQLQLLQTKFHQLP
jgi:hypothetical protein